MPSRATATAADVAEAALYLASDQSRYLSGVALPVDGGWLAEKSFAAGDAASSTFLAGTETVDDASSASTASPLPARVVPFLLKYYRGRSDVELPRNLAHEVPHAHSPGSARPMSPEPDAGAHWFRAPGRVNLIGDHTDYNDGFVLPLAIDRGCTVACVPRADRPRPLARRRRERSTCRPTASADPATVEPGWGRYVAGVVRELAVRGRPPAGMDAVVASDLPIGSGLSSSAALEVACALALADAAGWQIEPAELAEACRDAEAAAVGVPCGIMDQLASIEGRAGSALLIDCRSLEVTPVPLTDRLAVLVVHSGIARSLDASAYAERRHACEQLAARLGLAALRDATLELVSDEPLGRHVVTENERVLAAARALADADLDTLGACSARATRACATTSASRLPSWTCSSRSSSPPDRSVRA